MRMSSKGSTASFPLASTPGPSATSSASRSRAGAQWGSAKQGIRSVSSGRPAGHTSSAVRPSSHMGSSTGSRRTSSRPNASKRSRIHPSAQRSAG